MGQQTSSNKDLESTRSTSNFGKRNPKHETRSPPNDPSNSDHCNPQSLITQVSKDEKPISSFPTPLPQYLDHDKHTILLPPQSHSLKGRGLLVLDLDETLVHSSFRPLPNPDIVLPVQLHDQLYQIYVKKRPHVDAFLESVAQHWEVVVFTASLPEYAGPVIDRLDPTGSLVHHRLYRQHCVFTNGLYIKDLGRLGRPLHRTVIIDNSPTAYLFHPRNALPITSWFDNPDDKELLHLLPALQHLAHAEDMYPGLASFQAALDGR